MNYTKLQILSQSGTSMLAQANQARRECSRCSAEPAPRRARDVPGREGARTAFARPARSITSARRQESPRSPTPDQQGASNWPSYSEQRRGVQRPPPAVRDLGGLSKSMEKLSSGYRINRAADDAAGLAISEKMRGQIRGTAQAQRNAQDGISLVQTAEGALNEMHSILQRVRELSIQFANGTLSTYDQDEITAEVAQLTAEIVRIRDRLEVQRHRAVSGAHDGHDPGRRQRRRDDRDHRGDLRDGRPVPAGSSSSGPQMATLRAALDGRLSTDRHAIKNVSNVSCQPRCGAEPARAQPGEPRRLPGEPDGVREPHPRRGHGPGDDELHQAPDPAAVRHEHAGAGQPGARRASCRCSGSSRFVRCRLAGRSVRAAAGGRSSRSEATWSRLGHSPIHPINKELESWACVSRTTSRRSTPTASCRDVGRRRSRWRSSPAASASTAPPTTPPAWRSPRGCAPRSAAPRRPAQRAGRHLARPDGGRLAQRDARDPAARPRALHPVRQRHAVDGRSGRDHGRGRAADRRARRASATARSSTARRCSSARPFTIQVGANAARRSPPAAADRNVGTPAGSRLPRRRLVRHDRFTARRSMDVVDDRHGADERLDVLAPTSVRCRTASSTRSPTWRLPGEPVRLREPHPRRGHGAGDGELHQAPDPPAVRHVDARAGQPGAQGVLVPAPRVGHARRLRRPVHAGRPAGPSAPGGVVDAPSAASDRCESAQESAVPRPSSRRISWRFGSRTTWRRSTPTAICPRPRSGVEVDGEALQRLPHQPGGGRRGGPGDLRGDACPDPRPRRRPAQRAGRHLARPDGGRFPQRDALDAAARP